MKKVNNDIICILQASADALAREVCQAAYDLAGGIGERPWFPRILEIDLSVILVGAVLVAIYREFQV